MKNDKDAPQKPVEKKPVPMNNNVLWIVGVLALADGLVSWGNEGAVRRWSCDGKSMARCWIAPAPIEVVVSNGTDVWVGLLGRPHRLLFEVA